MEMPGVLFSDIQKVVIRGGDGLSWYDGVCVVTRVTRKFIVPEYF